MFKLRHFPTLVRSSKRLSRENARHPSLLVLRRIPPWRNTNSATVEHATRNIRNRAFRSFHDCGGTRKFACRNRALRAWRNRVPRVAESQQLLEHSMLQRRMRKRKRAQPAACRLRNRRPRFVVWPAARQCTSRLSDREPRNSKFLRSEPTRPRAAPSHQAANSK